VIGRTGFLNNLQLQQFCNRPQSLRCDLTVPYFLIPQFECLSMGHSSDGFGDPINCHFTCWILGHLLQTL
jgi:hypothetical protein